MGVVVLADERPKGRAGSIFFRRFNEEGLILEWQTGDCRPKGRPFAHQNRKRHISVGI